MEEVLRRLKVLWAVLCCLGAGVALMAVYGLASAGANDGAAYASWLVLGALVAAAIPYTDMSVVGKASALWLIACAALIFNEERGLQGVGIQALFIWVVVITAYWVLKPLLKKKQ